MNTSDQHYYSTAKTAYTDFHSKLGKKGIYGQALGVDSPAIKDINNVVCSYCETKLVFKRMLD